MADGVFIASGTIVALVYGFNSATPPEGQTFQAMDLAGLRPGQPIPGKPQQITATAFLNRIPEAALPVLYGSPETGVMLITLAAASVIDLTDPAVQAGITALVPGVLTAEQAAAILDH